MAILFVISPSSLYALENTSFNQPRNNKLLFPLNIGHVWCLLRWKLLLWPYGEFDSWVNKYIDCQASGRSRLCSAKRSLPFVLIKATAPFCLLKHFHSKFLGWFPKGNRTCFLHPFRASLIESPLPVLTLNMDAMRECFIVTQANIIVIYEDR
jgi:hypothetical protein